MLDTLSKIYYYLIVSYFFFNLVTRKFETNVACIIFLLDRAGLYHKIKKCTG